MNIKIGFEESNPTLKETFNWEEIRRNDGLYEIVPDTHHSADWAIFISNGQEVFVTAKDGNCILAVASSNWEDCQFIKSRGRLVISN